MHLITALKSRFTKFPLALVAFVLLLGFHVWGVTRGWDSGTLYGNEFRQTQTALTALFVARDHNYSIAYPTPVLGKPWSIPFEFPLYQWCVAALSNATGASLIECARGVSAVSFYATLPALWLLLARIGVARPRRWLVLSFVISCPLYIFYARAFLIETMALMFCVWFLCGYVFAVEKQSRIWLLVANLAGIGAGLVKVTTFIGYLIPAAIWSLVWLYQDWRSADSRMRKLLQRLSWITAATAVPFVATYAWLLFADATKGKNPASVALMSASMHNYNWGTMETRFSPRVWADHWHIHLSDIINFPILAAAGFILLLGGRRYGWPIVICLGTYLTVQTMFPILYAWHEYYYVAIAILLMIGIGLGVTGLFETGVPRPAIWLCILAIYGCQLGLYFKTHYPSQINWQPGGNSLTEALQDFTDRDDVVIISGLDWSSFYPFYSQRRTLMLRRATEVDWALIHQEFKALAGEQVRVLMLCGDQRNNTGLKNIAADYFGLERTPALKWNDVDLYIHPALRPTISDLLRRTEYGGLIAEAALVPKGVEPVREIRTADLPERQKKFFQLMHPMPVRSYNRFGLGMGAEDGRKSFGAHPDTRLWFQVQPGMRTISANFFLGRGAYQDYGSDIPSDGITFSIHEVKKDGTKNMLFERTLDPLRVKSDRGFKKVTVRAQISPESEILIAVGPGPRGDYTRDWAGLGEITIE